MTSVEIADIADLVLSIGGGVLLSLFGFRVIGKSAQMDTWHKKWGKHMRLIGPAYILLTLIRHFVFA